MLRMGAPTSFVDGKAGCQKDPHSPNGGRPLVWTLKKQIYEITFSAKENKEIYYEQMKTFLAIKEDGHKILGTFFLSKRGLEREAYFPGKIFSRYDANFEGKLS